MARTSSAKVTNFDKNNVNELRDAINQALASIETRFGVKVKATSCTYANAKAEMRLSLTLDNDDALLADFRRNAKRFGLGDESFGKLFHNGNETYKLVGFETRRSKYCVVCVNVNTGKTVLFPETVLRKLYLPKSAA